MKKYILGLFIVLSLLMPSNSFGRSIAVFIDNVPLSMDVPPIIVQGRTLVPISLIGRSLNANVVWNEKNKSISISKGPSIIRLSLDSNIAYVNDKMVILEVPARAINGRTMVPLSFISTAFNENVRWDSSLMAVLIDSEIPVRIFESQEEDEHDENNNISHENPSENKEQEIYKSLDEVENLESEQAP